LSNKNIISKTYPEKTKKVLELFAREKRYVNAADMINRAFWEKAEKHKWIERIQELENEYKGE
jgi:hypothetical protein